ncbi:MAG: hypothetical protein NDF57_05115 [archaeon GBS-70-058]|nr:hypothetical protein [Candidatus Culexarchaeum nevadense]
MPVFLMGGSVTLSANTSGELKLRAKISGTITGIFVNSSGRCEISNIEIGGYRDIFEGAMEVDQLKVYGNYYPLKEPIPITVGQDIIFALKDISGASNTVYIALEVVTA